MASILGEKKYYPKVRKWLENEGYYCGGFIHDSNGKPIYFQDKGTARSRVDVAGIKDIGTSREYGIEVVVVEVRDIKKVKFRDIQDAFAYSQFAHKAYLAITGKFDKQDKEDAHRLGIGLLQIKSKQVEEILSPKLNEPTQLKMQHFLNVLEIARCMICGCYFETYIIKGEYTSFYKMRRPKYFKIAYDHREIDALDSASLRKMSSKYKISRYICKLCKEELFPQI